MMPGIQIETGNTIGKGMTILPIEVGTYKLAIGILYAPDSLVFVVEPGDAIIKPAMHVLTLVVSLSRIIQKTGSQHAVTGNMEIGSRCPQQIVLRVIVDTPHRSLHRFRKLRIEHIEIQKRVSIITRDTIGCCKPQVATLVLQHIINLIARQSVPA